MSGIVTYGTDPKAKTIKVYYEGSDTLYEGYPLCYNQDTTTNWLGVSSIDATSTASSITESSTTAEGSQNEGKFIRVEKPAAANQRFLAGFVTGSGDGITGPCAVDIHVPNGAVIPVWTDRSVSIGDAAYTEPATYTIPNDAVAGGLQIGWFMETVDRSSTAGVALAKVQPPEMSSYASSSTLGVGLSPLLWGDAPSAAELADPGNGISFFDDFLNQVDVTTGDGWTLTQTDTKGSIAVEAGAPGGIMQFKSATGDSADDGISAQLTNCAVLPAAGTNIWFEARIKVSEADEQWAIGLCAVDTTVIAAGIFDDVSDKILFGHHTGTADKINTITARAATQDETADVADMTDDTWVTVGFKLTGLTSVEFYVNGALVETGTTVAALPNAAMCLTAVAQYEAADTILSVDWVKLVADGGRDA